MGSEGIWVPPGGSADPRRGQEPQERPQEQVRQPTEQEIAELREQLAKAKVSDVLVEALHTVYALGYHKLSAENRDLEQARVAIDSVQALLPVLEGSVPEGVVRDFRQALANMQFAYADAVEAGHAERATLPDSGNETAPAVEDDAGPGR
jgi:hypothetical protein